MFKFGNLSRQEFVPSPLVDQNITDTAVILNSEVQAFGVDYGSNSFTPSHNGPPSQSHFSPFRHNWSCIFREGQYATFTGFALGSGDFAVEFWVNTSSRGQDTTYRRILSQTANDFRGYQIMITDQDWVIDGINTEAGGLVFYTDNPQIGSQVRIDDDLWHFVVFQRRNGVLYCFVDGELQQSRDFTLDLSSTATIFAGAYAGSASQGNFVGYLTDLQIAPGSSPWNVEGFNIPTEKARPHPSSEVLAFSSRDYSNKARTNKTITRNSYFISHVSPFQEQETTWNWTTYFDGTNDSVDVSYDSSSFLEDGDFTIEFWQLSPSKRTQVIVDAPDADTVGRWTIITASATGFIGFTVDGTEILNSNFDVQDNTWHHIAFVRNGTNLTIFVDGTSRNTTANFIDSLNAHAQFRIGCTVTNTNDVLGHYSNFRIVKGTALYLNNFHVSEKPLEAIDGTVLLTFKDNQFIDYSPMQRSIAPSVSGTPTFQYIGPFWEYIPTAGSLYFDGGDTITIPANSQFDLGTGVATVEFWAWWIASSNNYDSWAVRASGALYSPNRPRYTGGWRVTHGTQFSGANTLYGSTINVGGAVIGEWQHVVFNRNANVWKIWVNGNLLGTATYGSTPNLTVSEDFSICSGQTMFLTDIRYTRGNNMYTTDKFPVYRRPMENINERGASTANVEAFFNSALGTSNRTTESLSLSYTPVRTVGAPYFSSLSPFGPRDWIPYFNGSTSRLYVRWDDFQDKRLLPQTGENFTWEAWIRPEATTGAIITFGNETASDDSGRGEGFHIDSDGFSFKHDTGNGIGYATGTWPSAIPLNQWSHIAVVRDGATGVITPYLNGVPGTGSTTTAALWTTLSPQVSGYDAGVYIGYRNTDATYFRGHISNVRFTKSAVYQGQFTPNYRYPLTVLPETALLTCTTPTIYDRSTNNFYVSGTIRMDKIPLFTPQTSYNQQAHGCAMHFSASGNFLYGESSNDYNIMLSKQWTWEAWVWPVNSSGAAYLFTIGNLGGWGNAFILLYNGSTFAITFAGGTELLTSTYTCSNTWSRNCWHHVAVTWDDFDVKVYVNGRQQISVTVPSDRPVTNATYYVVNGLADVNGVGNNGNAGRIHGIRLVRNSLVYTGEFALPGSPPKIYNDTQTKILLNFDDAMYVDRSGQQAFRFNGTALTDTKSPNTNTSSSSALKFDGATNYITIEDNYSLDLGDGDFTIDFWIRKQSSTTYTILSLHTNGDYAGLFLQLDTSGRPVMRLSEDGASWANTGTGTVGFGNNAWAHYAIVRYGTLNNNIMVFVNGVISLTYTNVNQLYTSTEHYIGKEYTGAAATNSGHFLGYIDDFRITPGVARYTTTAGFTPPTRKPGTR